MQINERKRNVIVSSRMFKIKMEKKKKDKINDRIILTKKEKKKLRSKKKIVVAFIYTKSRKTFCLSSRFLRFHKKKKKI